MIKLIKNYKYNNKYDYIKTFTNKAQQKAYFNSLPSIEIDDTEYVKDHMEIRVEYDYEDLVLSGVNYLIFNNGLRDVYAFITRKEYVRKNVTRLNYEIDVIQTFLFDITINKSFIERKVCNMNEITDFDEGLYLGEHSVVNNTLLFNKSEKYFAMFNGFKEQELIFNDNNKLISVADIPYNTSKPLTTIDDVQYPLYFMPLLESSQYAKAIYEDIGVGGGGTNVDGDVISKKLFRYIKGFEAFASESYVDSGGVPTIGYGITESSSYWSVLFPSCTEQKASEVLAEAIYNSYAKPLYQQMQADGVDMATVKQNNFDAFVDLAYNAGLGGCTSSPMYERFVINPNDISGIISQWENYYIRDNNGNILQGLIDRRREEINMFRDNVYNFRPIGIVVDNAGTISGTITDNNGNGYVPSGLGGDL